MDTVWLLGVTGGASGAWWSGVAAAWIGAIGGSACGLLGAAVGVLGGIGARRGMFRRTVLGLCVVGIAAGVLMLGAGLSAWIAFGQPFHVWYPLVLLGGILTLVLGINAPVMLGVYRQAERRRLEAGLIQPGREVGGVSA